MKHFLLALFAVTSVVSAASPQQAHACSCMMSSPEQNFAQADAAFLGTVSSVTKNGMNVTVTFDVERQWKGIDLLESSTVKVRTADNSAACGVELTKATSYVVYAFESDGVLTTNLCSGTAAEEYADADLKYLAGTEAEGGDSSAPKTQTGFSDVPLSHANAKAIAWLKMKGWVAGYEDGTYRPEAVINRAEFTKIIMGAVASKDDIDSCLARSTFEFDFSDVPANAWFEGYVCQGRVAGAIGGYPDRTFRPSQNVTFVEAAKIIVSAMNPEISVNDSAAWYAPYVNVLNEMHATPRTIVSLDQRITRGEMAEIVYRLSVEGSFESYRTF